MSVRIRHVALVAEKLEPVVEQLESIFGIEVGFRDPNLAEWDLKMENALLPVGDTFLDVVMPTAENYESRLLKQRNGDGGYLVLFQVDDLGPVRQRFERLGVRVKHDMTYPNFQTLILSDKDPGAVRVEIKVSTDPTDWPYASQHWRDHVKTEVVTKIYAAELQAADPETLATRWSAALERPATREGDNFRIALDDSELRIVPDRDGRGDGFSGVDLVAADADRARKAAEERGLLRPDSTIEICGIRFRLL